MSKLLDAILRTYNDNGKLKNRFLIISNFCNLLINIYNKKKIQNSTIYSTTLLQQNIKTPSFSTADKFEIPQFLLNDSLNRRRIIGSSDEVVSNVSCFAIKDCYNKDDDEVFNFLYCDKIGNIELFEVKNMSMSTVQQLEQILNDESEPVYYDANLHTLQDDMSDLDEILYKNIPLDVISLYDDFKIKLKNFLSSYDDIYETILKGDKILKTDIENLINNLKSYLSSIEKLITKINIHEYTNLPLFERHVKYLTNYLSFAKKLSCKTFNKLIVLILNSSHTSTEKELTGSLSLKYTYVTDYLDIYFDVIKNIDQIQIKEIPLDDTFGIEEIFKSYEFVSDYEISIYKFIDLSLESIEIRDIEYYGKYFIDAYKDYFGIDKETKIDKIEQKKIKDFFDNKFFKIKHKTEDNLAFNFINAYVIMIIFLLYYNKKNQLIKSHILNYMISTLTSVIIKFTSDVFKMCETILDSGISYYSKYMIIYYIIDNIINKIYCLKIENNNDGIFAPGDCSFNSICLILNPKEIFYKNKDNKYEIIDWHNVVKEYNTAEIKHILMQAVNFKTNTMKFILNYYYENLDVNIKNIDYLLEDIEYKNQFFNSKCPSLYTNSLINFNNEQEFYLLKISSRRHALVLIYNINDNKTYIVDVSDFANGYDNYKLVSNRNQTLKELITSNYDNQRLFITYNPEKNNYNQLDITLFLNDFKFIYTDINNYGDKEFTEKEYTAYYHGGITVKLVTNIYSQIFYDLMTFLSLNIEETYFLSVKNIINHSNQFIKNSLFIKNYYNDITLTSFVYSILYINNIIIFAHAIRKSIEKNKKELLPEFDKLFDEIINKYDDKHKIIDEKYNLTTIETDFFTDFHNIFQEDDYFKNAVELVIKNDEQKQTIINIFYQIMQRINKQFGFEAKKYNEKETLVHKDYTTMLLMEQIANGTVLRFNELITYYEKIYNIYSKL